MDWKEERKQIRRQEKKMRKEYSMKRQVEIGAMEANPRTLQESLKKYLPSHLIPSNVGGYSKVAWPFWFQANFDLGTNPTLTNNLRKTASFQVSNESSLILMAVGRKCWDYTTAGELAPLQIDVRDRQSTRQFNDKPIPLQMIGNKSRPSILPTPMIISPNAFIDVTLSSWLPDGVSMATTGSGKIQLSFFGYRTRAENANEMMSLIYG